MNFSQPHPRWRKYRNLHSQREDEKTVDYVVGLQNLMFGEEGVPRESPEPLILLAFLPRPLGEGSKFILGKKIYLMTGLQSHLIESKCFSGSFFRISICNRGYCIHSAHTTGNHNHLNDTSFRFWRETKMMILPACDARAPPSLHNHSAVYA